MMNRIIKTTIALLLIAAMACAFAACGESTNSWAVKVGDVQVDSGVYLGYLVSNYLSAESKVETTSGSDVFAQKIDDKDFETWVLDKTMENCLSHAYIEKCFADLALELTEDEMNSIESSVENTWANMSYALEKNGCSKASLQKIYVNASKSQKIFEHYYYDGGEKEVPIKEQKDYFLENYAKAKITYEPLFNSSTFATLSEDEVNALVKEYRNLVSKVTGGADFADTVDAYNDSKNEKTETEEKTEDEKKEEENIDPDRYTSVISKTGSSYPEDLIEKLFGMKDNEVAMVQSTNYVFLVQRIKLGSEDETFALYKSSIINAMKEDEYTAWILEEAKKLDLTKNDAAIARFSVKNIPNRYESSSATA